MEEKEIWKDIEGFEGLYQISNMGRVKSLNYRRTGKEKIMKLNKEGNGYLQVQLCQDGKAKLYLVHRLVATAFCENPHGFKEVNHKDEDKTNNCAENLEYCSRSYNNTYNGKAKKAGKKIAEKLRNNSNRSKPVIGIYKINDFIFEFPSALEASRVTGVNQAGITRCCKGKCKSAGGFYWYYADAE